MSSSFAIGPFTHMKTAEPPVLVAGPVVAVERVAERLDGRDDDRHVLGLAAGHHGVDRDFLGGDRDLAVLDERAAGSDGSSPAAASMPTMRSSVGGTTGNPSVQPLV